MTRLIQQAIESNYDLKIAGERIRAAHDTVRVAAKAQEELYDSIRTYGGAHKMVERMQTRKELYETIDYSEYEALDASIAKTIIPSSYPKNI